MTIQVTSVMAYNSIKIDGLLSKRRFEVYEAIFENGPITISQMLKHLVKFSRNTGPFTGRISELKRLGVIKEHSTAPCPITGRMAIRWVTTNNLPIKIEKETKIKCKHCNGKGYHVEQQSRMF